MVGEYFKEAVVETEGHRTRYLEGGSGDPIVQLDDGGGLERSPALELLAKTFHVFALETPGPGTASIEDRARRMNAAIAALGIERFGLIGVSSAAKLALWMAILRPESVEAIVLSSPDAFGPPHDGAFEKRAAELTQPILALFGTLDNVTPPDDAHRYRELLQDCNIMFVYNAAHAIETDRPEAFASMAGDFLTRKDQFLVTQTSALIHP